MRWRWGAWLATLVAACAVGQQLNTTAEEKPSKFDEVVDDKMYIEPANITEHPAPKRIRRGTVWRRYVRFPGAGRPWEYGPRSPRLVFRDLEPAPGLAPSWSHNQLLPEDQPQDEKEDGCSSGSCQSLLGCWLAWGRVGESCPGFLSYCCDHSAAKASTSQEQPLPLYGPVTNDPSKTDYYRLTHQ